MESSVYHRPYEEGERVADDELNFHGAHREIALDDPEMHERAVELRAALLQSATELLTAIDGIVRSLDEDVDESEDSITRREQRGEWQIEIHGPVIPLDHLSNPAPIKWITNVLITYRLDLDRDLPSDVWSSQLPASDDRVRRQALIILSAQTTNGPTAESLQVVVREESNGQVSLFDISSTYGIWDEVSQQYRRFPSATIRLSDPSLRDSEAYCIAQPDFLQSSLVKAQELVSLNVSHGGLWTVQRLAR